MSFADEINEKQNRPLTTNIDVVDYNKVAVKMLELAKNMFRGYPKITTDKFGNSIFQVRVKLNSLIPTVLKDISTPIEGAYKVNWNFNELTSALLPLCKADGIDIEGVEHDLIDGDYVVFTILKR